MTATQVFEGLVGVVAIFVVFVVPLWIEFEIGRGLLAIGRGLIDAVRWVARWVGARFARSPLPRAIARRRIR